jgi:hypothetical protein
MDFKVDEKKIQDMLIKQIIESGLGKAIEKAVQDALKVDSYNSPIKQALETNVKEATKLILEEQFGESIRNAISERLKEKITADLINSAAEGAVARLTSDY